jgi:hypothetical protein
MVQAAINNGEDECLVWQIFAARGMGHNASVAGNGCDQVTEGFDVPPGCECVFPQPPNVLQTTVISSTEVELSWPSQASTGAIAYQILRSDLGCSGPFLPVDSVAEPLTVYTDEVPGPGGYGYAVKAVPALGSLCGSLSDCVVAYVDCTPGSPDVTVNSFKAGKTGPETRFVWSSSGSGDWNIHTTADPSMLGSIHTDPASIAANVSLTEYSDSGSPAPGEVLYFKVFGADACTGESVP